MKRLFPLAAASLAALLASCAGKSLNAAGEVALWSTRDDPELAESAGSMSGLAFAYAPRDKHWSALLAQGTAGPDLVVAEWGRDVIEARSAGSLADLAPYGGRMTSMPFIWKGLRNAFKAESSVYPASLYCWGLFYNPAVLSSRGLEFPKTWKAFQASLPEIKKGGAIPIALGGSSGWPALAWLGYLDIRMNGIEAYRSLVSGKRGLGDESLAKVYAILGEWRDAGLIGAAGSAGTWTEALSAVESGRAAYALMGTFAMGRFAIPDAVRWAPLPSAGAKNGEIVAVQGFALSSGARAPEAALALADAYVRRGAAGMVSDAFRVAAIAVDARAKDSGESSLASVKGSQEALLRTGAPLAPQLDRVLPSQAAYDANQVLSDFFRPSSRVGAAQLGAKMARVSP